MTKPAQAPHRNHPAILNHEHPAPFVIGGDTPGGALAVPIHSARIAAQAARYLTEHCPHIQATWQASPQAGPGPVAVFGRTRPPAGEHLPHQDTHAFLLAPGEVGAITSSTLPATCRKAARVLAALKRGGWTETRRRGSQLSCASYRMMIT